MIKTKKNVLIMAEHHGGVRPWYQAAYDRILQDTPYQFDSLDRARGPRRSCAPWRGPATRPLLLINHWLDTGLPNPNDAAQANAHRCARQPGRRLRAAAGSTSRPSWPSTSTPGVTS